jgi:hypothetical protein
MAGIRFSLRIMISRVQREQVLPGRGRSGIGCKGDGDGTAYLRGTPFIYEGQELGFTNVAWDNIDCYDDISSHGQYEFSLKEGFSPEQALGFRASFQPG